LTPELFLGEGTIGFEDQLDGLQIRTRFGQRGAWVFAPGSSSTKPM
jgi:hypothetical protein